MAQFETGSVIPPSSHRVKTLSYGCLRTMARHPGRSPRSAATTLVTRLNGREMQRATTDDLIFGIPALIAYCSTSAELGARGHHYHRHAWRRRSVPRAAAMDEAGRCRRGRNRWHRCFEEPGSARIGAQRALGRLVGFVSVTIPIFKQIRATHCAQRQRSGVFCQQFVQPCTAGRRARLKSAYEAARY